MEFGKSKQRISREYKLEGEIIQKSKSERSLGVFVSDNTSPEKHINKIVGETYKLMRRKKTRVAFIHMDEERVKKVTITLIRPRLEYAATVCSQSTTNNIRPLKPERIQRAATTFVPYLLDMLYEERLAKLELTMLEQRRQEGD